VYPILSKSYSRADDVLVVGCYFKFYYCIRRPRDITRPRLNFIRYCLYARLFGVHDKLPLIVTSNKHSYTLLDYRNVDFSFSSRTDIIKLLHLVLYDHFLSTDNFQFVDLGVVYDQTVFIKHLNLVVDFRNQVGFSNIRFLRGRILNGCFGADRVKG
jgi:hypothetical protein